MNDTARTPTAEPNPDSAPPRTYTGRTSWASGPPPRNIPVPRTAAGDAFRDFVESERAARNAARWDLAVGLGLCAAPVCLPSRVGAQVFDGEVVHGGCQIIDDPIDPGSERYQQARRGVPYPRGTRAQRRRTATARVQARRRKARAAVAAVASWFRTFLDAGPDAVDSVPADPYDPVVAGPGAFARVTCV